MQNGTDWATRSRPQHYPASTASLEGHSSRQPMHRPHTSMGAAGHWIHMAGLLAPLVIGEFVTDANKRWKAIRMVSVVTALAYEGLHTMNEQKRREELQAERDRCCDKDR